MKQIYLFVLAFFFAATGFSSTITLVNNAANWNNSQSWTPSRLPANGDTIFIPAGFSVTLDNNMPLNNVVINISGLLQLANGKLRLDDASRVIVTGNGKITGSGNNDQVIIGSTEKFKGTQLTQIGPAFADKTTGIAPAAGFVANSMLPVTFTGFYVSAAGNDAVLNWRTSTEMNNKGFEIQRSLDGINWAALALVNAAGGMNISTSYTYTDKNIGSATAYYRICQVDIDGRRTYSVVKTIRGSETAGAAKIYAANKTINVELNGTAKSNLTVTVVNFSGQVIARQQYSKSDYRIRMSMPGMNTGIYVVQVSDGGSLLGTTKIML